MFTSTIGLFDKYIKQATLYGLQFHFHAPSEHSIDGKLLDLEMHIVHEVDPVLRNPNLPENRRTQFSNGVLGVLFKVVPDDYFAKNGVSDFHDKFLCDILDAKVSYMSDLETYTDDPRIKAYVQ